VHIHKSMRKVTLHNSWHVLTYGNVTRKMATANSTRVSFPSVAKITIFDIERYSDLSVGVGLDGKPQFRY